MSEQPPPSPPPQSKPPSDREDALAVVRRLRGAGHVAYFAGGCVRDALLGLTPKDYDVATDAPPTRVRELFSRTQAVGAAFGVILVRQGRSQIEVATFRSEGKYLDGRRPENVTFTTAEEDARRRDFTINGLFYDPIEERVIDHVGGQEDLKAKRLRAIGDANQRFEEDHLRLLRAIRFAARFDLEIEDGTWSAIGSHMERLARISPERIADELRAMLTPPTRTRAWGMLMDRGFEGVLFRFLKLPWPVEPQVFSEFDPLFEAVAPGRAVPFGLALAAATLNHLMYGTPPAVGLASRLEPPLVQEMVQALRRALRLSNDESEQMQGTLEGVRVLLSDRPPQVAALKRFLARPTSGLSRELLGALGHHEFEPQLRELEKTEYAPPPLITGDDLTAAGLAPGRVFKKVLNEVYDAQLEGRVTSKEEALALALGIAREG